MENTSHVQDIAVDVIKTHMVREFELDRPLLGCRFDPTGRYLVAGAQRHALVRWDLASGERIDLAAHDSWVRAIAITPDGETLLSGGYDGRVAAWPLAEAAPQPRWIVQAHDGWTRAVVLSPDGNRFATCGNDNRVKIWSLTDGRLLDVFEGHERHVYHVAFHPTDDHLVSCDLMGAIKHWDVASGEELRALEGKQLHTYDKVFWADMGGARDMAFNADGTRLAVAGVTEVTNAFAGQGQPIVSLYDWARAEPICNCKAKEQYIGVAWGARFHPAGPLVCLFSGHGGGSLMFFQPDAADEVHRVKLPSHGYDLDIAPDGVTVAVAHYDRKLRLYRLAEKAA